jgi:hypothetical protein
VKTSRNQFPILLSGSFIFAGCFLNACQSSIPSQSTTPNSNSESASASATNTQRVGEKGEAIAENSSSGSPENFYTANKALDESLVKNTVKVPQVEVLLKQHFPRMTRFEEISFLPWNQGGTSFTGLVTRLLGTGLDPEFEGIRARRFFYVAYEGKIPLGAAHASSDSVGSRQIDTSVIYTAGGTLIDVKVQGLPNSVESDFEKSKTLQQFIGRSTEDFEVILGRKGRLRSKGAMFKALKYPASTESRNYFEKIFRSLRFNTAFMDVAFFITQHPDLADKTSSDGTEEVSGNDVSSESPESFVRGRERGAAIDGKP